LYDFETLVGEVLRNRPEINRESLMELVSDKKRSVGGGYLTDQGALFLIAGEFGIRLNRTEGADLTLKDVQAGVSNITLVARVLAVYPIAEFQRKDGTKGRYRRVNLFDASGTNRLTIWDDNETAIQMEGIGVDTPVRITSAYVKPGLDGKPNLNLGKFGKIEVVSDPAVTSRLSPLAALTKRIADVGSDDVPPAVEGVVASDGRTSEFVRDDGSTGSLTQFDFGEPGKKVRVVVWNASGIPVVKAGTKVMITNLRNRKGRQGEPELHGDNATVIRVLEEGHPEPVQRLVKVADAKKVTGQVNVEVLSLSRGSVREVNLKDGSVVKKGEVVVGDDTGEITLVGWRGSSETIGGIQAGEKLRVYGATIQMSKMGVETLELGGTSSVERVAATGQSGL
jgi:ssDNA-binding replication factor A large subunit